MNTHETYVSLEVAKLLKQAGFDWEINTYYIRNITEDENYQPIFHDNFYMASIEHPFNWNDKLRSMSTEDENILIRCSAPTLAVAQRWLREVKECDVYVSPSDDLYFAHIKKYDKMYSEEVTRRFIEFPNCFVSNSYESALEAGIKKCLKENCMTDKCSEE